VRSGLDRWMVTAIVYWQREFFLEGSIVVPATHDFIVVDFRYYFLTHCVTTYWN